MIVELQQSGDGYNCRVQVWDTSNATDYADRWINKDTGWSADYWVYDTVKQYFSDKFNSQVANVRQKINSKEFKIFDQFYIQGKLYGIYRDKALPVITSYYVKKYSS